MNEWTVTAVPTRHPENASTIAVDADSLAEALVGALFSDEEQSPDQVVRYLAQVGIVLARAAAWGEDEPAGCGAKDPRPTIVSLYSGGYGTTMSERPSACVTFSRREAGEDAPVFYEGAISQSGLFRVLLAAGLLRRRVDALKARRGQPASGAAMR